MDHSVPQFSCLQNEHTRHSETIRKARGKAHCEQPENDGTAEILSPSPRSPGNDPSQPSTYVPVGWSARAPLARLRQARSQVCSAAGKSRCTTKRSAASSSRTTAADGTGTTRTGSLLLKAPPTPLSGAADVERSLFMTSLGSGPVSSLRRPSGRFPGSSRIIRPGLGEEGESSQTCPQPLPRPSPAEKGLYLRSRLASLGT